MTAEALCCAASAAAAVQSPAFCLTVAATALAREAKPARKSSLAAGLVLMRLKAPTPISRDEIGGFLTRCHITPAPMARAANSEKLLRCRDSHEFISYSEWDSEADHRHIYKR